MVYALSTGHEIGLALVGGAFIVFALVSSFVLPTRNPNFPGKARNVYLVVCAAFFLAMMAAVLVFGKEKKAQAEAAGAGTPPAATTTTSSSSSSGGGQYAGGNAAAGAAVFKAQPCGSCHTFKPAGTNAKVGPDLDNLAADAQHANEPVDQFVGGAITSPPPPYVPPGYVKNAMPKLPLSAQQVKDLVAYLTSGG